MRIFKAIERLLKYSYLKIKYGKRLICKAAPRFKFDSRIIIDKSSALMLGKSVEANRNVSISAINGGRCSIGDNVGFNRNDIIICHKNIEIGDKCNIGPNVCIYDHDHNFGYNGISQGFKTGDVVIGKGCWIGAGAVILRNTHIGEYSVIGAGCVVKGDIPAHSVVTCGNRTLNIKEIEPDK